MLSTRSNRSHYCVLDGVRQTYSNLEFSNLLVTTHLALSHDLVPDAEVILSHSYTTYGIKDTIASCVKVADCLISTADSGHPLDSQPSEVLAAIAAAFHGYGLNLVRCLGILERHAISIDRLSLSLDILYFPKRFGYSSDDTIDAYSSIIELNKLHRTKYRDHLHYACYPQVPEKWTSGLSAHVFGATVWANVPLSHALDALDEGLDLDYQSRIEQQLFEISSSIYQSALHDILLDVRPMDKHFPNGKSFEGYKTYPDKVHEVARNIPYLLDRAYPFGVWSGAYATTDEPDGSHSCRLAAVPKDYKSKRIVAPEPVFVNWAASALRRAFERYFKQFDNIVPFDDQSKQQDRIKDGTAEAVCGQEGFCSIDLHSASDSIPLWHIRYASGPYWHILKRYHAQDMLLPNGKHVENWIYLTSGNALTWIHESLWFLCMCFAGIIYQNFWDARKSRSTLERIPSFAHCCHTYKSIIGIYGDDVAITSEYFDAITSTFEVLGYTVNVQKSYSGLFAESCGCYSYKGIDVTPSYWPRKTLMWNPKASWKKGENAQTLSSIIALQHRLYFEAPSAAHVLEQWVLEKAPGMTYSVPNSECNDLWGMQPPKLVPAPHDRDKGLPITTLSAYVPNVDMTLQQACARSRHYNLTTRYNLASQSLYNDWDLEMYLYVRWLIIREQVQNPNSGIPSFIWINGSRYDSVSLPVADADLLQCDGEVEYILMRD